MTASGYAFLLTAEILSLLGLGLAIALLAVILIVLIRSKKKDGKSIRADHFAFPVSELTRSVDFYVNKLGLKLLSYQTDRENHEAFAFFELEGGNLELLQALDENNKPIPFENPKSSVPYSPHLAIGVDSLEERIQKLKEKNLPIAKGPLEIPGHVKWLYVHDPDQNTIEFVEWLRRIEE